MKFTVSSLTALLSTFSSTDELSGCTGITTYIRRILCRNIAYRRPCYYPSTSRGGRGRGRGGGRSGAMLGLVLGRRLDRAFQAYALRRTSSPPACLRNVVSRLRACGLRVVQAQVAVGDSSLGLRTELDGLCVDVRGRAWVLELKNTQMSVREHRFAYDLVSPGCVKLLNGYDNSERERHCLQTGFGMYAFSKCFSVPISEVRGLVVVNCSDGCVGYPVDGSRYASQSHFSRLGRSSCTVDAC